MVDLTLYSSRMTAYKDGTKDSEITAMQDDIMYEFKSNPSYQQILYNGEDRDTHIVDNNKSFSKKVGQKKLLGYPNDLYTDGDYLELFNKDWIILSKDEDSVVHEKCYISECNADLILNTHGMVFDYDDGWSYDNGIPYSESDIGYIAYPCLIESSSLSIGLDLNNPFDVSNGIIRVSVKNDEITQFLLEGDRFIFGNKRVFKITNITDFISNVMVITMQRDAFNPSTDKLVTIGDKQHWIANYTADPTPLPVGMEIIITPDVNYVKKSNALGTDFTAKTYANGSVIADTYTFTIDSSSTAISGQYTLTVVDGDTFNIKSLVSNKKVIIKIQSVTYPSVSILKTVNLMLY